MALIDLSYDVLDATSTRSFGGGHLRTTVFLERGFRAHVVYRDRLLIDTRFAPPVRKSSSKIHLYAQVRGTLQVAGKAPVEGPQAYLLAESEFDRVHAGSLTFRSHGAPGIVVELKLPAEDCRRPIGLANGPLSLSDDVWAAYSALEVLPTPAAFQQLVDRLVATGIVSTNLTITDEPERFTRLWAVLRPLYEEYATSTSLKQISILSKLSLRQLGRDLGAFARTFGLFGTGYREAIRVLRLRAALVFLSAPEGTPGEVAREVGYGSLEAMDRAFRDAKLPAPSTIQQAVRYGEPTLERSATQLD